MCLISDSAYGDSMKVLCLRERLSVAVRSIQWSYVIFWTLSTRQQGLLEWGNGYYNGYIKTRKTLQSSDIHVSDIHVEKNGLERSKHLRELYEFLLEGDPELQGKRQSAVLSPEDLTHEEWYYLMSMTYVFDRDEGLPGKVSTSGKPIWLSAAPFADSSLFSRSLLAKSASIQTVVCFPYGGGVIEFGVTEMVSEDPSLLQHIKTSLLEISKPICSDKYCCSNTTDDDKDPVAITFNRKDLVSAVPPTKAYWPSGNTKLNTLEISDLQENDIDSLDVFSADIYSNDCEQDDSSYNSLMAEQIKDNNTVIMGTQRSGDCNDCVSQAFPDHGINMSVSVSQKNNKSPIEDCRCVLRPLLEFEADNDLHYKRTLSAVLGNFNRVDRISPRGWNCQSSFLRWADKGKHIGNMLPRPQSVLKNILFSVPYFQKSDIGMNNLLYKSSCDDYADLHSSSYGINDIVDDEFISLRSTIPYAGKKEDEKAMILEGSIQLVKELETKVEELEFMAKGVDEKERRRRDMTERSSDNYESVKAETARKRKAVVTEEIRDVMGGVTFDMKVEVEAKEAVIEMRCPWRDYLLVDIMEAVNNLHLDAYAVRSTTLAGVLNLTLHSKFRGGAVSSSGVIKRALWKVVVAC